MNAIATEVQKAVRPPSRRRAPAVELLERRELFAVGSIPVTLALTSTNIFPTTGTFVLTAKVSPAVQTAAPTPTGTVTFFDGVTQLGIGLVEAGGVAAISPLIRTLGDHTITADYSGDFNYATGASSSLVESVSSATAIQPVLSGALPKAAVVAGQKTRIHQSIILSVAKDLSFNGPVSEVLYLASGPRIDSTAIELPQSLHKKVKLKGNLHATLAVNLNSLPATVPTGNYYLIAKISDASGSIAIAASSATIGVEAPRHDLAGSFVKVPATAKAGRHFSATVLVTNEGNVPLKGALQIDAEASVSGTPDANLAPAGKHPINLQPGRSVRIAINGLSVAAAGNYFLIAQLDPNNAFGDVNVANNTFVSTSEVIVSG